MAVLEENAEWWVVARKNQSVFGTGCLLSLRSCRPVIKSESPRVNDRFRARMKMNDRNGEKPRLTLLGRVGEVANGRFGALQFAISGVG